MDSLILMSNKKDTIKPNMVMYNIKGASFVIQIVIRQKCRFLSKSTINFVAKPRIELGFSASETLVLTIVRQGHGIKIANSSKIRERTTVETIL